MAGAPESTNAPVIVPPANATFSDSAVVIVVEKLASSPIAAANSSSVSRRVGAALTKLLISVVTKPVDASWVVDVPAAAVAAVGVPLKSIEFINELERALIKGMFSFPYY